MSTFTLALQLGAFFVTRIYNVDMKKPGNRNKAREKAPVKKNYNNIKEYKVTKECELLEFLLETFKNQSRNSVKSLLSSHRVSIDGAPVSQFNFKLYPEDTIIISNSPIKKKTRSKLPLYIYHSKSQLIYTYHLKFFDQLHIHFLLQPQL